MKVLVPLDGSAFSESAVEQAVKLAKETTAEVHLLSVLNAKHVHRSYAQAPEQKIALSKVGARRPGRFGAGEGN